MEWSKYLAFGVPPFGRSRKLIGGNWKCNATAAEGAKIMKALNEAGPFPQTSEVEYSYQRMIRMTT
jgi:hypothetical protein